MLHTEWLLSKSPDEFWGKNKTLPVFLVLVYIYGLSSSKVVQIHQRMDYLEGSQQLTQ